MECAYRGGPPLNNDVSGIGVRVSFYLQTLFLACLSARSDSLADLTGSLHTLIMTNVAMAVTALISGLRKHPLISFHDGLVVVYLLYLSWFTVVFALPSCNRFKASIRTLKIFSVVQSYTIFAFALTLLIQAKSFGNTPECNSHAVVVLFRPFSALIAGRIVGWIVTIVVVTFYSAITAKDYLPPPPKQMYQWVFKIRIRKPAPQPNNRELELGQGMEFRDVRYDFRQRTFTSNSKQIEQPSYELPIAWDLVIRLFVICVFWSLTVMNTELLIAWNRFDETEDPQTSWQFGQVLPMFLVVLPLLNVIRTFNDLGLRPQ